jgi:coxsackievirus/adenovirus receptor
MLDVNNLVYNLQEKSGNVLYGTGVGECGNNPCQPNPCKNGAPCQVKEAEMFHCKCINGYSGEPNIFLTTDLQFTYISGIK